MWVLIMSFNEGEKKQWNKWQHCNDVPDFSIICRMKQNEANTTLNDEIKLALFY